MAKEITVHLDLLGQELSVGCHVVASRRGAYSSSMCICKITKFTPKKITIQDIKKGYNSEWSTYPAETVKLVGEEVLAYILKYA